MNDTQKTKALVSLREKNNDLRIVAKGKRSTRGFTLLAILRNEMYFLPAFLDHYRQLGVERFVFLNDRSDDGSFEYLLQQPDTTIVESGRIYGDTFDIPHSLSRKIKNPRILYLWRAMLHDMFAPDDWAIQVDLDEFVHLPDGFAFQHVVERLERQKAHAAWGVMLNVYPQDFAAYSEHKMSAHLDLEASWYYDGERHVRLRHRKPPQVLGAGSVTRLCAAYGIEGFNSTQVSASRGNFLKIPGTNLLRPKPKRARTIEKPVLVKWGPDCYYASCHRTNRFGSDEILLPIVHYRFAGNLELKIENGLRERSYHLGSRGHNILLALLKKIGEENGSFLYRNSRPVDSFSDFADTGNALGL